MSSLNQTAEQRDGKARTLLRVAEAFDVEPDRSRRETRQESTSERVLGGGCQAQSPLARLHAFGEETGWQVSQTAWEGENNLSRHTSHAGVPGVGRRGADQSESCFVAETQAPTFVAFLTFGRSQTTARAARSARAHQARRNRVRRTFLRSRQVMQPENEMVLTAEMDLTAFGRGGLSSEGSKRTTAAAAGAWMGGVEDDELTGSGCHGRWIESRCGGGRGRDRPAIAEG